MIALHGQIVELTVAPAELGGLWRVGRAANGGRRIESCEPGSHREFQLLVDETGTPDQPHIRVAHELNHLSEHDIISIAPKGDRAFVLWRNDSLSNTLLLTERCDNYCIMCSQPPKEADDSYLLSQAFDVVAALRDTPVKFPILGITGGEPTLYGDGFVELLQRIGTELPTFEVHVLSNGRRFADETFCAEIQQVISDRVVFGIPIYGTTSEEHDAIVGADGAFVETIIGIHNLVEMGALVEIRVVLQQRLVGRLNALAEFIARNLPGTVQVALMGLELMGFARSNFEEVWIDPIDYSTELKSATRLLAANGCNPRIFNHPLCVLPPEIRQFAVSSISDWKREYDAMCEPCAVKRECGGFFTSATRGMSRGVTALSSMTDPGRVNSSQSVPMVKEQSEGKRPLRRLVVTPAPRNS